MTWTNPIRLTPITQSQSPGVISSTGPPQPTPALLQTEMHLFQNCERFFCSVLYRCAISYIAFDTMRIYPLAFKFGHSSVEGAHLNVRQHHPHFCSSKLPRQGKADAARSAGYERALSLKFAMFSPYDLDFTN